MTASTRRETLAGGFTRRGACPALSAPMQTGDGLLVRLNPVAGGLSPSSLVGLCNAALAHGNGIVEVTARGSLQIRGLTATSAAALASDVDALGIAVRTGIPVQTGALAGLDPDEICDPTQLADDIRYGIVEAGLDAQLGPKVSVVVDGGGRSALHDVAADVRLTAVADGIWRVAVAGDAATAKVVGEATQQCAVDAALKILSAIAAQGLTARARDLNSDLLLDVFKTLEAPHSFTPPSVLPDISPARGEISQSPKSSIFTGGLKGVEAPKLLISPLAGGPKDGPRQVARARASGRTEGGVKECDAEGFASLLTFLPPLNNSLFALGLALPFGHTSAETLAAFAKRAKSLGVSDIRLAPKRTVIALCPSSQAAEVLRQTAEHLDFITTPSDPRQNISACPGAPACASGYLAARELAAEIADDFAALDGSLHISGCAKGCAHPGRADITIVGRENGAGIVVAGTARDVPLAYTAHAKRALKSVLDLIRARKGAVNSSQALQRLEPTEIARVFGSP